MNRWVATLLAALSLLVLSAVLGRLSRPPVRPTDLRSLLAPLRLRVVATPSSSVFYVADRDAPNEALTRLPRSPERLSQWSGVLYLEHTENGEGVHVGGWTLFGDPVLIDRVGPLLR